MSHFKKHKFHAISFGVPLGLLKGPRKPQRKLCGTFHFFALHIFRCLGALPSHRALLFLLFVLSCFIFAPSFGFAPSKGVPQDPAVTLSCFVKRGLCSPERPTMPLCVCSAGACLYVLNGHTRDVNDIALSAGQAFQWFFNGSCPQGRHALFIWRNGEIPQKITSVVY